MVLIVHPNLNSSSHLKYIWKPYIEFYSLSSLFYLDALHKPYDIFIFYLFIEYNTEQPKRIIVCEEKQNNSMRFIFGHIQFYNSTSAARKNDEYITSRL